MNIIDDLKVELARSEALASPPAIPFDPILFLNEEGRPWTLGMVLSMWRYVFTQSVNEVCGSRDIAF